MDSVTRPGPTTRARVRQVSAGIVRDHRDDLATEEPLEIRIQAGEARRTVAITMRTPGADFELAAGFLYGEGVIAPGDLSSIAYCTDADVAPEARYNTVTVRLSAGRLPDLPALDRHFVTSSACGVCGTASLDALRGRCSPLPDQEDLRVSPEILYGLPHRLREGQGVFGKTGGLHAAGLFTVEGELLAIREDVGRHNAVDKLVGWALMNGRLPLGGHILMVSGRSSYEIMQKALAAGVPVVCAVSAPSSLAVDLAREFGMTLVGFLRDERFNLYSAPERVVP
ncbi:formate dehydrogenase accessory sulfurtransferase FdhD [Streptosporangium roseum]|uniref:Sulfur carrier protein FdhD n=1 Tax=Streptosporangium roseum (strain ATCC 12428 / DSM 43021 / JCM 3005 / KCTC 9067 / NCIMB 10171 / NRRL 2505 / NI 9100) TaxID=479432 RepID=D2BD80_STRRD|nr:formate dehydrogenase accessory sulfurtransferase FdhD [Streptosporangium roseum]ACZ84321.1 formate dehydrogenase [Streptosporangium roseum DSM 43021]